METATGKPVEPDLSLVCRVPSPGIDRPAPRGSTRPTSIREVLQADQQDLVRQAFRQLRRPEHADARMRQTVEEAAGQPPEEIRAIQIRSPSANGRVGNSEGETASPLCSTTTERGGRPHFTRKDSRLQGKSASIDSPFAIT